MNEYKGMTISELRRFVGVMEVALNHAKNTGDAPLTVLAQRDIDEATRELASRS